VNAIARARTGAVAVILAIGYLLTMYLFGAQPTHENRARSSAAGLLGSEDETVISVRISANGNSFTADSRDGRWRMPDGDVADTALHRRIDELIVLFRRSPPVRIMTPEQTAGVAAAAFGLQPPALRVEFRATGQRSLLAAQFGDTVSNGVARYLRTDGVADTYIVSGFLYDAAHALLE